MSSSEIAEVISEYVETYRRIFNIGEVKPNSPDPLKKEHKRCQGEQQEVLKALAAFQHHASLKDVLDDDSEGAHQRAIRRLTRWAGEVRWPDNPRQSISTFLADSPEECCEITNNLMKKDLWPFLKVIR